MKPLNLLTRISVHDSGAKIVRIDVTDNQLGEFCLRLTMLRMDIIDSIEPSADYAFDISKPTKNALKKLASNQSGYVYTHRGQTSLKAKDELIDNWLLFFLSAYKTDRANPHANHVDYTFYAIRKIPSSEALYLTLRLVNG